MNNRVYKFKYKDFKKAYKLADDLYSLCVILNDFCMYHSDDEDIRNLIAFTKLLRKQADELNNFFCEVDMNVIKDGI